MLRRLDPARLSWIIGFALVLGLVAGLTSALLLTVTGEPLVADAIAIEEARSGSAAIGHEGGAAEPELVSRSDQSGLGLFAALGLSGAAFGLLFALAFWGLRHGQPDPFRRSLVAGAILF
nr:CbtA family protein [Actinomycetota bacterium]